ncbi:zinc finger protein 726-like isoform X2 [Galleria mellonella]|uniref:Zinc finger protein 726-like isoform X2 n=1 Tax=Galleria mellonella TaxID=7137 RepID=A0ABM3MXI8_GALME|nr:zinc finger protein 726-like isoform X2 [Galleria mellonella]
MEVCRTCLVAEKNMMSIDETFVNNYNVLTNLNITLCDGLPQSVCQNCLDVVKFFMEFREKSILSESTLRSIVQDIKEEEIMSSFTTQNNIKILDECNGNIKQPYDIKVEFEDNCAIADEDLQETFQRFETEEVNTVIKKETEKNKTANKMPSKSKKMIKGKKKETTPSILICGMCENKYADKSELIKHFEIHVDNNYCQICSEKFNCWPQLFSHRLVHLPEKGGKCHICGKRYATPLYLEYHYRTLHYNGETMLQCSLCSRSYGTPRKLRSHMRSSHAEVKYICDYCSKRFIEKSTLRTHIRSHSEKKTYVCDLCGFSCKYSTGLKSHHIRRHTAEKVICAQCKRPFENQEKCDAHKCNVHIHICPVCGKEFKLANLYNRHLNSHREVGKYKCDRCPATYKTRQALTIHINRHDGTRTKQCEFCPAKFYSASVLIKHRRTHTGEKPYVCKVCKKAFTGNHNLKVHMKVHGEYLIVKKNKDEEETK